MRGGRDEPGEDPAGGGRGRAGGAGHPPSARPPLPGPGPGAGPGSLRRRGPSGAARSRRSPRSKTPGPERFTAALRGTRRSPCPGAPGPAEAPPALLPSGRHPPGRRGLGGTAGRCRAVPREANLIAEGETGPQHLPLAGSGCPGRGSPASPGGYSGKSCSAGAPKAAAMGSPRATDRPSASRGPRGTAEAAPSGPAEPAAHPGRRASPEVSRSASGASQRWRNLSAAKAAQKFTPPPSGAPTRSARTRP